MNRQTRRTGTFIVTREHKRFVEVANTVRRNATIGLLMIPVLYVAVQRLRERRRGAPPTRVADKTAV